MLYTTTIYSGSVSVASGSSVALGEVFPLQNVQNVRVTMYVTGSSSTVEVTPVFYTLSRELSYAGNNWTVTGSSGEAFTSFAANWCDVPDQLGFNVSSSAGTTLSYHVSARR